MNVELRHLREADFEPLWEYVSDPEATRLLTWPAYTDRDAFRRWFDAAAGKTSVPDEVQAITVDGRAVGSIHMIARGGGAAVQYGVGLARAAWGRGIASEVVRQSLAWLARHWAETPVVWADIHRNNDAAKRVFEKNGFVLFEKEVEPSRDRYIHHLAVPGFGAMGSRLVRWFYSVDGVEAILNVGSPRGNELSDHDFLVVFREESALNAHRVEMADVFRRLGTTLSVHAATPTHWFAVYDNFEVLDVHLVSSSLLWAISNRRSVIDRAGFLAPPAAGQDPSLARELFVRGATLLRRALGKLRKGEHWVVPRFLTQVREQSLLPLLKMNDLVVAENIVKVSLSPDTPEIRLLLDTFASPAPESCERGIAGARTLFTLLAKRMGLGEEVQPLLQGEAVQPLLQGTGG